MLFLVTASHTTTDFAMLERLSAHGHATSAGIARVHPGVRGAVVLATCNRYEVYLDLAVDDEDGWLPVVSSVVEEVARATGVTPCEVREASAFRHGSAAVRHLFAVASGLESVVVGEDEIAGQVRRALESAEEAGASTPELATAFQRAVRASRAVRGGADVGAGGRSIVDVALDLAQTRLRSWEETRVLLIGTGRYASISAAALRRRGVTDLRAHSVSGGGGAFAMRHGVDLIPADALAGEAAAADLVIACTTAKGHVLDAAALTSGPKSHDAPTPSATVVVDLGLPRNVDPDVGDLPGVSVIDLGIIGSHASLARVDEVEHAKTLVWEATEQYVSSARLRDLSPALVSLRRHVLDLADAEVERARVRGGADPAVEEAIRHFASVLLHRPMARARALAEAGDAAAWIDGIGAVFGIDAGSDADAAGGKDVDPIVDLNERCA